MQAEGKPVVAVQLGLADAKQELASLDAAGALNLSAARILQLEHVPVAPQRHALWLELHGATASSAVAWLKTCPQLVKFGAHHLQVREEWSHVCHVPGTDVNKAQPGPFGIIAFAMCG
jgi:hypothetical protein